jgi:hypothetical protein
MVAVNHNEVFFIYILYFTHVITRFGPCGPSSGKHYRFLEASYCLKRIRYLGCCYTFYHLLYYIIF